MILRLIILLVGVSFAVLMFLPKGGGVTSEECKVRACELGYPEACITNAEAADIDEQCKGDSCICLRSALDICYKNHGTCGKVAEGCGWQPSKDLNNCIRMTEAAETIKQQKLYAE